MTIEKGETVALVGESGCGRSLSALAVLSIGLQLTETMTQHLGISRAESANRAADYLRMVGIPEPEHRLKQYPHHLSGGMRQRVMIAMALCCEPALFIWTGLGRWPDDGVG